MMRIILSVCILMSIACRREDRPDRGRYDEYGCEAPDRYLAQDEPYPDPDAVRDYENCRKFNAFLAECKERGYAPVGNACRRVRDGKKEYTGRTEFLGDYGFSENWWSDCKPHAVPATDPGDDPRCFGVEAGDDPAKTPWPCVAQPPEWCPPNP